MGRKVAAQQPTITFADHIRELRARLFVVAAVFILASCLAYIFREPVLNALLSPLHGEKLVYLNPAGGFNFIFLISIYAGLALTIPILIQQLYAFLKPALPVRVQHYAGRLFIFSLVLLVSGIAFGYYMAIPGALHFLYSFADQYVTASLTADSYLNFIIAYTIGLGIVFQLPLLVLFFHWIKPLSPGGLMKSERWVILLSFIAAAIITPTPDPLNQTIIALPVILVYQLGVLLVMVAIAGQRRRLKKAAYLQAFEPIAKPLPTVVRQPQRVPRPAYRRSVDGFVVHPRPAARPVVQSSVTTASPRPRPVTFKPSRSIDGMLSPA